MSCKPEHIIEKILHVACESSLSVHHLFDHKHCKHIIEPVFKEVSQCASKVVKSESLYAHSAKANILGEVICLVDDQIAQGICSLLSKATPTLASKAKDAIKVSGPISLGIGLVFVGIDVAKAPQHQKLERFGKSSAKLALTTGATVLGTCIAGPAGACTFSIASSFIADWFDH